MSDFSTSEQTLDKLTALEERVKQGEQITAKLGRMVGSLVALLESKGVTSKSEIMSVLYERLRGSGALERAEAGEETA